MVKDFKVHSPLPSKNMKAECDKATDIIKHLIKHRNDVDTALIPKSVLRGAKGIAVISIVKAGFGWSGRAGSGIVVARLPDGRWSAPSCIATGGVGFGLQIGAQITDTVFLLNTDSAVKAFSSGGNVTLGGNLSVAAGPVGRSSEASGSVMHLAPVYSYSKTKGLFAGLSFEGSVLIARNDANSEFYNRKIKPGEILSGQVEPPVEADNLYRELDLKFNNLEGSNESNMNQSSTSYDGSSSAAPPAYSRPQSFQQQHRDNDPYNKSMEKPPRGSYESTAWGPPKPSSTHQSDVRRNTFAGLDNSSSSSSSSSYTPASRTDTFAGIGAQAAARAGGSTASSNSTSIAPKRPPPPIPTRKPSIPVQTRVIALYDFEGQRDGDLSFKRGDIIEIVKRSQSRDDWWTGKCHGRTGEFPGNYTEDQ